MPITLQQFLDRLPAAERRHIENQSRELLDELKAEETLEQLPEEFRAPFKDNIPPAKLGSFVRMMEEKIERYTKRVIREEYESGYKNGYDEGYKQACEDH